MKKSKLFIVGLIALLMVGGLVLAGCDKDGDDGGGGSNNSNNNGGGCPNRTCFYNNDNVWSFCNQESCALAYDYDAKCDCK